MNTEKGGVSMENKRHITDLCDMPINPKALSDMKAELSFDPDRFIEGKKVIPTQVLSINSHVFIAFIELAGSLYAGLDWNKKGRIVVEYDPRDRKFEVATFQEAEDLDTDHNPGEYPDFLLRREDRRKL